MRRKITIITALCLMVGAAAAYATAGPNNYAGSSLAYPKVVGTPTHPVAFGWKETLNAKNNDSTKVAEVLIDVKTKTYGIRSAGQHFPTCSGSQMQIRKSDTFCPTKSKFASGLVNAYLGDPTLAKATRIPCNPNLDVFNAGPNKLWFFFVTHSASQCAGLTTGQTAPYPGYISYSGKYEIVDVPLPPDVSTMVAGQNNFYGSLAHEVLNWFKVTTIVKGKTVGDNQAIGCLNNKRPWSITFTSTPDGHTKHVQTLNGSSPC